ncbi:MAG: hypothetical protein ACU84H_09845 [Gammaproteobacteria bacterium]
MSNEENAKKSIDAAKNFAGNLVSKALDLKEKNPKVFYGGIGGIAVLLLLMMMSGGDNAPSPEIPSGTALKNLAVGQTYSLKSANSYDPSATIRLVSAPGTLAAYDDSEEADRTGTCTHFQQGTRVKVLRTQEISSTEYAEVSIEDGECKGKTGWAFSIELQ